MSGRSNGDSGARRAAAAGSAFEMTHSLRLSLPKTRWRPPRVGGVLTDALGGAIFVLIAGGGWLIIADLTYQGAPQTAETDTAPVDLAAR